jgi:CheY-like chemotaxis protein
MRSSYSSSSQNPATILLVDDNHDGVLARRSVLEELGYNVVSAPCGADALARTEEQNFDLVVTDYKMSPMNGLALITELRRRNFAKPIILLSGFAESIGLRAESTGADVVIQKSANEIATLVRQTNRLLSPKKPAASQRASKAPGRAKGAGQG